MTAPYLVPCLVQLRTQFNHEFPGRDTGADGWIGDTAHQAHTSDHNPDSQGRVLAVDVDVDLKRPGLDMADCVETMLTSPSRLEYVIYSRTIWSRSNDYRPAIYTGTDPHTNHAHFSARHDHTGHNDTAPWGLEDLMTKSEFTSWMTSWAKSTDGQTALGSALLNAPAANSVATGRKVRDILDDFEDVRALLRFADPDNAEVKAAGYPADSPLVRLLAGPSATA